MFFVSTEPCNRVASIGRLVRRTKRKWQVSVNDESMSNLMTMFVGSGDDDDDLVNE